MVGGFQQGNDGHIYFVANNQTGATFNIQILQPLRTGTTLKLRQ